MRTNKDRDPWGGENKELFGWFELNPYISKDKALKEGLFNALLFLLVGLIFYFEFSSGCFSVGLLIVVSGSVGFLSGIFTYVFQSGMFWSHIFHIFVFCAMIALVYVATGCGWL